MKSFVSCVLVLAIATIPARFVHAAACTAAQLRGQFNSFRITGGGGTFFAGTEQVVSFDHPTGSPVNGISAITIVPSGANSPVFNPTVVSGVPVTFPNINASDFAGSIDLFLPNNLPAGAFVYRLNLTILNNGTCTLDSIPFTSLGSQSQQCTFGTSQCQSTTTFVNCTRSGTFGPSQTCPAGTSCQQTGTQAICTSGVPTQCTVGTYQCSGTGYKICFQGITGPTFTDVLPCGPGTSCVQIGNSISCAANAGPANECTVGRCVSTSQFQSCIVGPLGNNVFSTVQTCPAGTSCTGNGICTSGTGNTCTSGNMRCTGASTFQQCNQGTFGVNQSCPTGTTCAPFMNNFIICQ